MTQWTQPRAVEISNSKLLPADLEAVRESPNFSDLFAQEFQARERQFGVERDNM